MKNEIKYHVNMFTLESIHHIVDDEVSEKEIMYGLILFDT
jgi:hypothetical protein